MAQADKTQLKDLTTGKKLYPITSSDCVGMPDGSGNLTTYLKKRVTEINVSNIYPTNGFDGGNTYTLETAIAQVPAEYRSIQGLKITFINNSTGKTETWKYDGGTFTTTTNWKHGDGSGGNMILTWNTDVATTRKQVLQQERKKLLQISYENDNGETINEQYIGTTFTDTEWIKDTNWSSQPNAKDIANCENLATSIFSSKKLDIDQSLLSAPIVGGRQQVVVAYQFISAKALRFFFVSRADNNPYWAKIYCADDLQGTNEIQIINQSSSDGLFHNNDVCVLPSKYVKINIGHPTTSVTTFTFYNVVEIEQIGEFKKTRQFKTINSSTQISGGQTFALSDTDFGKTDKDWYISFLSKGYVNITKGSDFILSAKDYIVNGDTEKLIDAGQYHTKLISASYNNTTKQLDIYVNSVLVKSYSDFTNDSDEAIKIVMPRNDSNSLLFAVALDDKSHTSSEIESELSYYYGLTNIIPSYKAIWFGEFDNTGTIATGQYKFNGNVTIRYDELPRTDFLGKYLGYNLSLRQDNAKNIYGYNKTKLASNITNTTISIYEYIDVQSVDILRVNKDKQWAGMVIFMDLNYNIIFNKSLSAQSDGNGYEEIEVPYNAKWGSISCGDKGVTVVKRSTSMGVTEETPEWLENKVRDKAIVLPVEFNRFKYNNFGAPNNADRNIYTITEYTDNTLTISEEELKQFYNTSDEITNYAWYDVIVKDAEGDYHRETIAYSSTTKKLDRIKETDDADYEPVYFAACIQNDHPSDYNYRYMGKMMAQCISDVTNYKHLRQWNHGLNNGTMYMTTPFGKKAFGNIDTTKKPQERNFNCFLYQEGISYAPYASSGYDAKNIRMGLIYNSGSFNSGTAETENYSICRLYGVCPVQDGYFQLTVASSRQKADSTEMSRIKIVVKNDNVVVHEQLLRGGGSEVVSIPNKDWEWGYVEIEFVAVSISMEYAMSLTQANFYELTGFEYYKRGTGIFNLNNIKYPSTSDFTELSSILSCGDSWSHWLNNNINGKADEVYLKKTTQVEKLTLSLKGKTVTEFDNIVKIILRRYDKNDVGRYKPNNQFFVSVPKGSNVNTIAQLISEALSIEGWSASSENEIVTFTANVTDVTYQNYYGVLDFYCSSGEIEATWEDTTFQPSGDLIWFDTYKMWEYTDNLSMTGYLKKYSKAKELDIYGLGGQTSAYMFYLRLKEALNNGKRYTHAVVEYFTNDQTIDQTYIGACVEMLMANGIKPIIMGSRSGDEGHWKL